MAEPNELHKVMIERVARALGKEMLGEVVFVGGSTTGLLVEDSLARRGIRFSEDVDLVVDVVGHVGWTVFQEQLLERGFVHNLEDKLICRMRLDGMKVDFMPQDETILGFGNRWYRETLDTALENRLADDLVIRHAAPPYFLATKLEAYNGRGNDDPVLSRDVEDILHVVAGRPGLTGEIEASEGEVRRYVAESVGSLLGHEYIEHAVSGNVIGEGLAKIVFDRLSVIATLGKQD